MKIAVLGCGAIAARHIRTIRKLGLGVSFVAASSDPVRAREFAQVNRVEAANSYDDAVASNDVDIALITSTPDMHLGHAMMAIDNNCHVIVEKPPFQTVRQFDDVCAAATQKGRQLLVAENYFYRPVVPVLRQILESGAIGRPLTLYVNAQKKQVSDGDWRSDPAVVGGGALLEGGIHWVNFMQSIGMDVKTVTGIIGGGATPETERTSVLNFEYENGAIGVLAYSWETPTPLHGLRISRIFGDAGSVVFESNGLFVLLLGNKKRLYFPGIRDINGYQAMFADFLSSLSSGNEPAFTAQKARADLDAIESVYNSIRHREPT